MNVVEMVECLRISCKALRCGEGKIRAQHELHNGLFLIYQSPTVSHQSHSIWRPI